MKDAYLYLRVSGLGQVDGYDFNRQEESCKAFAKKHGLRIVGVYREKGVSGTTDETDRPAFQEMMAAILSNGVNTIVIESMDRLARELRVQETLLVYLASKGVELYSARTEENITQAIKDDPMKKALIQIQGVFAELEKNQLVLRLRKGREKARQDRGKCEGRKAFGESAEEKAVIRRVKALRRRGLNGRPRHTLQEIADRLNSEGEKTKTGGSWHPTQVQRLLQRPSK